MLPKRKGLGKGLDSLIPDRIEKKSEKEETKQLQESSKITNNSAENENNRSSKKNSDSKENDSNEKIEKEILIKINLIEPNRSQPRKEFDEDALLELADSIKQYGILQPLLVQKRKNYFEIIAGERRWRAAKLAGLKEVPVLIKDYTDQEIVEISLIENIQRENLNPIEEALAFKRLLDEFHLKQDEIAERVSKSRTAVTNSMRLLKLDTKVQQMIVADMITTGHARTLLAIENKEEQQMLANKIFDEKLSVRETEKLIKSIKNKKIKNTTTKKENNFIYSDLEDKIQSIIGTKVIISEKSNGKGKIEIEYYSERELERIYDLLMSIQSQ